MNPQAQATPPTTAQPGPPSADAARRAQRMATPRLTREMDTIAAMMRIYCRDHHAWAVPAGGSLCPGCVALLGYARKRLENCTYGPEKPTCVNCPIHCYGARQREAVRVVMRYAGPRMLARHPLLAVAHLIDGRRPAPPRPGQSPPADAAESAPPPPPGP